jgi:formylmethanofuran dehydrogenase subunit B
MALQTCPFCALLCQSTTASIPAPEFLHCPKALAYYQSESEDIMPLVAGQAVSLDVALDAAAIHLHNNPQFLIWNAGTDVAGSRAALQLAACCHAIVDTVSSEVEHWQAWQTQRCHHTSWVELALRADVICFVGIHPEMALPRMMSFLSHMHGLHQKCKFFGIGEKMPVDVQWICTPKELPEKLALLLSILKGRGSPDATSALFAESLRHAQYAVFVWLTEGLGSDTDMCLYTLYQMIDYLNTKKRCTGLALSTVCTTFHQVSTWRCGVPARYRFYQEQAYQDTWQYDAQRLLQHREVDSVLYLDNFSVSAPSFYGYPPIIMGNRQHPMQLRKQAAVWIPSAITGIEHAGHLCRAEYGNMAFLEPIRSSHLPSMSTLLMQLTQRLLTLSTNS